MTKLTKSEKILRKSNEKWKNFLAEGAFKKQTNEVGDPDQYYSDMPTSSDYKYSAAEKFKKGEKIKVRSVKKGYATGGIEPEPENVRCKTGTVKGFDGERLIVMLDNGETVSINGRNASNKDFQWDNEVMFSCPEEQVNEARMGEYGKIDAEDGNPPSKIGRGNEEYMAAYNAVLQARGEEPLDIQQPDQAFLDALRSGQLEEAREIGEGDEVNIIGGALTGAEGKVIELTTTDQGSPAFVVLLSKDADKRVYGAAGDEVIVQPKFVEHKFYRGDFGMELYDIDEKKNLKEEITKRVNELLSEGLTPEQIQEKIIEEGIGDFIRKGIDTVKQKTGLGMSMGTRKAFSMARTVMSDYGTFLETEFPNAEEIKVMTDYMKQLGGEAGGKGLRSADSGRNAMDKLPRNKRRNLQQPNLLKKEIRKFLKEMDAAREALPSRRDKTAKKALQVINAAEEQLEGKIRYLSDLNKAFNQALRTGETEAVETVARLEREEDRRIAKAAKITFSKEQEAQAKADREAGRQAKRDASRRDDKEQDIVRGKSTERFGKATNMEERSADDERDLEEPVKYGSGAELEFDPKAQKFYDRKRDMYIDDPEEEDNLTREDRTTMSSDPELDQIEDIARDMLEAGIQNSRIPVGLMSVASALNAQGFDANVSNGVLNVDGKYFMGKKENFDISPSEDVRQIMGYVLGYMG